MRSTGGAVLCIFTCTHDPGTFCAVTTANCITVARLLLTPVVCALVYLYNPESPNLRWAALAMFLIAAGTDGIDGYVARHFNQQTRLGQRLDPLADKLLVNLSFVFVAANPNYEPNLPMWFPPIIVARDTMIVAGAYAVLQYKGDVKIRPRLGGKLTTGFQFATLVAYMAEFAFAYYLLIGALLMMAYSLVDYLYTGSWQLRKEEPA